MTERQKEIIRIALRLMAKDLARIMADSDSAVNHLLKVPLYDEFDDCFTTIQEEEVVAIIKNLTI